MSSIQKIFLLLGLFFACGFINLSYAADKAEGTVSTKKERNHITKGNKFYEEGKFKEAMQQYKDALEENSSSVVGRYNLGLSEIQIGSNPNDTSAAAKKLLESGVKNMQQIANMGSKRPELASRANYNLGNVAFNSQDYQKSIDYYKQALRLNPSDENARRNLRIAQLKLQNEDQQQDQNQDQQDQEQDKEQEQEQDQNQDQNDNQDQNQDQQEQNQDQQDQQSQSDLNQQTAEQILNAIENKENQTRARVAGQNAEKSRERNRNRRNW
ncbi:MAG: tetratricopeptide repeat protein [Muribaculaceae bacterium]|nr:tetratricopeptide repeat protein [Muribaculaceae bacterium]